MSELELIRIISTNALALWDRSLVGSPCENTAKMFAALKYPQPGQLVLEISSGCYIHPEIALGHLLRVTQEPFPDPDPEDEPILEEVVYIQTLTGVEARWTNARFIRVLESLEELRAIFQ